MKTPTLILINPWIYDFAAYDLWSKPLGLLYIAGYLRACGFNIHLIDCMDVHHPGMWGQTSRKAPIRHAFGTGKYWREMVAKPHPLTHVDRPYSRYGISRELFTEALKEVEAPAAILVTSLMTYWYPGVQEAIKIVKEIHPETPIILGGIYARLCREHALKNSGADFVFSGTGPETFSYLFNLLKDSKLDGKNIASGYETPYPAFDMLHKIDYIPVMTSTGCPYNCRYCANNFLNPEKNTRNPADVLKEIIHWHESYGVIDFAFYDDALLFNAKNHLAVILENLIQKNLALRFHTPNALHVRDISPEIAGLLLRAGFRTIRLGLETADFDTRRELDKKVSKGEFEKAVENLNAAGFEKKEIGAYIMMGLPGQSVDSVMKTIEYVGKAGAMPYLAEYSPLPHTSLWEEAVNCSEYDITSEPLFHNNTLVPCWDEDKRRRIPELREMVKYYRSIY